MPEDDVAIDRIRLSGISAIGYHGVLEHERREGQTFVADVVLHVDTRPAAEQDRLDRTVDYGVLAQEVVDVLIGSPADLLETVAERIAAVALEHEIVQAVDVVLHKPQAPMPVPFTDVTVEVHRDRVHRPVVSRTAAPAAPAGRPIPTLADLVVPYLTPEQPVDAAGPTAPGPAAVAPPEAPGDRMDMVPEAAVDVVLALGSNVGASQDTLRDAITALAAVDGLQIGAIAPLARSAPVGGPDQPDYLNTVVLGLTVLSPRALLRACQAIETQFGRVRQEQRGPRTLDIDIVLHGSTVGVVDDLELPHPRAHERAFVLVPWAHVDPSAVLPGLGGGPVAVLAETAPDRDGIRWMALDWWVTEARP